MNTMQGDEPPILPSEDYLEHCMMTENEKDFIQEKKQVKPNPIQIENIEIIKSEKQKNFPTTATLVNPQQIKEAQRLGEQYLQQSLWDNFMLSIMCGIFLSMGCFIAQRIGTQTEHTLTYATGEIRTRKEGFGYQLCVQSMLYPIGITFSILLNTNYFTGCLFMFPPVIVHRKAKIKDVLKFQVICLVGNLLGALMFAWVVGYWTVSLNEEGIKSLIAKVAEDRMEAGFGVQFIKGFGYAWVMSLTMLIYISAKSIFSKSFGLWFGVFGLACMGYEDVVSNVYYIVSGMMSGANITFGDYIGYGFLPQLLGHYLSSNFLVGLYYCYLYHWPEKK